MFIAILANGTPPSYSAALGHLRLADVLICCDGACEKARALGREPDYVVGDGDSVPAADRAALGARFVRVAEQDTNDMAKAFRFALGLAPSRIVILGATGLREDHALGNIFWLFDFAAEFPETSMVTDHGVFEVVAKRRTFPCRLGEALRIVLVIGLALSVVAASSTIHDEVANGTAAAALAKPVSRDVFLVGKWLGVMTVTLRFW